MKDRCKLFCRVAGSTAYYQLRDRVIDGTPCGQDTSDICVQGLCRVSPRWRALTLLSCCQTVMCSFLDTTAAACVCASSPGQWFLKWGPQTSLSTLWFSFFFSLFYFIWFFKLQCNWFTMLYKFQVYSTVIQLYLSLSVCIYIVSFLSLVVTKHWV